jgi:predicted ATPase
MLEESITVVELDGAENATTLIARLGLALGTRENVDAATVGHALRGRGAGVIVLDNFDRLVESGAATLRRWRDTAPAVRWVVTSRQRIDLDDDVAVIEVGPMTAEQAADLFELRVRQVRSEFAMQDDLRPVVAKLAAELDHIPLAVELAAARCNVLGPAEILERLPERFRLLRGKNRTLHGAIALSWDLLDDAEREALRQCTVFRGTFSAAAAEAVVQLDDDVWVLDVLQELVDRSLLNASAPDELVGEVRFSMLRTVHEYVVGQDGSLGDAANRHAKHYLQRCREHSHAMRHRGGALARTRLEFERDNLLAAFDRTEDAERRVDLALTLDKLFRISGAYEQWEQVLQVAAEHANDVDDGRRALVYRATGELSLLRGRFDAATKSLEAAAEAATMASAWVTLAWTEFLRAEVERRRGVPQAAKMQLERAVELARSHEIPNVERMALGHLASCLVDIGDLDGARECVRQMMRLPATDDLRDEARLLKRVAYAQHYLGNTDEQERLTRDALALARDSGDSRMQALCIQGLGDAEFVRGNYDDARTAWSEALDLHRAHGSAELEGALLGNLGNLEHRLGNLEAARVAYREGLKLHALTGAKPYEASARFGLGVLEFELGHLGDAADAMQTAAALNREIGNISDYGSCCLIGAWIADRANADSTDLRAIARESFRSTGDQDWVGLTENPPQIDGAVDMTVRACATALTGGRDVDTSRLHVRAALAAAAGSAPAKSEARVAKLRIATNAGWFEVDGTRVDMRRRRAPRHILARLVEIYQGSDAAGLDADEAFAVGWPGELATIEAANHRVYWAIRTLRRLGLEDFLVTSGDGYCLDPAAAIELE